MAGRVDEIFLGPGEVAPEQEDDAVAAVGDRADHGIGELLPADPAVAAGHTGLHGQHRVEQQHALPGPVFEVRPAAHPDAEVGFDFPEDVDQRGRGGHAVRHGEGQAHRLAGAVVGILAEDDDFHLREGRELESPENLAAGRIDGLPGGFFSMQETRQRGEVRFLELRCERVFPALFYLDIHASKMYPMTSSIVFT